MSGLDMFADRVNEAAAKGPRVDRLPFLSQGNYILQIERCRPVDARTGEVYFAAEFAILASRDLQDAEFDTDEEALKSGTRAVWMANMKLDAAVRDVVGFISEATSSPYEEVDGDAMKMVVSEHNPLEGKLLEVTVRKVETKKKTLFSRHIFRRVSPDMNAEAASLRETAGFPPL